MCKEFLSGLDPQEADWDIQKTVGELADVYNLSVEGLTNKTQSFLEQQAEAIFQPEKPY